MLRVDTGFYGGADDFLMRDRRLTQAARVEDTPECRVGFPILYPLKTKPRARAAAKPKAELKPTAEVKLKAEAKTGAVSKSKAGVKIKTEAKAKTSAKRKPNVET